jgi:hypothetical protein
MPDRQGARLRLEDGKLLQLDAGQAQTLYDELWRSAVAVRGAISAAAKIRHAQACKAPAEARVETLNAEESRAIRAALGHDYGLPP